MASNRHVADAHPSRDHLVLEAGGQEAQDLVLAPGERIEEPGVGVGISEQRRQTDAGNQHLAGACPADGFHQFFSRLGLEEKAAGPGLDRLLEERVAGD